MGSKGLVKNAKFYSFLLYVRWKLNPLLNKLLKNLASALLLASLDLLLALRHCIKHQFYTSIKENYERTVQNCAERDCLACRYQCFSFTPPTYAFACGPEQHQSREQNSKGQSCQMTV